MAEIWEIASVHQLREIIEALDAIDEQLGCALTEDEYRKYTQHIRKIRIRATETLIARERLLQVNATLAEVR